MVVDRRLIGAAAENAAREYLQRAGLRPVAANANYRGGELDLVMLERGTSHGDTLVFVEVRYRRSGTFGGGAASVDVHKRRRLVHAAQLFLASHPQFAHSACRFDVIDARGEPLQLEWIRDAFRADDC